MKFKDKECIICTKTYTPTGRCSKYCPSCRIEQYDKIQRESQKKYLIKKGVKVGVGSGGLTGSGKDNPYYRNGIACVFGKMRKRIKDERRYCERCNKDLKDVTKYHWCIHHKDHDRTNNVPDNFELLCKRCHQIEHECHKAFEGVTTKVERDKTTGRYKRIEVPDTEM